ncbi:MAG: peptidoglycan-binding protein, partial [Clostridia bacterium]|nr:peptidoglycan-binding protein [Clostridia bacterium]
DGTLAVKPGHEDAYKRALGLAVEELEESEDKKYTAFTAGGTTWFVERKKAAPKAAPEPEEELVENPFSGKLPAIIIAGVIIIGLIYLAVRLLGGGPKDDPTTQDVTPTPTAVSQNISWLPDVSPTPTPYVWSEPTQNTSIKYADWMAQPGDTSSTKPTATPFTPTPTPYNMWDELQHEIDSTWGSMTPTPEPTRGTIKPGSDPELIRDLQWQLIQLGWLDINGATGVYDAATVNAVKAFQNYMNSTYNAGLTVDGICGAKTFRYLDNYEIAVKPTPGVAPSPTPEAYVIDKNSSPLEIRELQLLLAANGWYSGEANGNYDAATMEAVLHFQAYVNSSTGVQYVNETGYADEHTILLLRWGEFVKPQLTPTPTPVPTPTAVVDPYDESDQMVELFEPADIIVSAEGYVPVYESASEQSRVLGTVSHSSRLMMLASSPNWAMVASSRGQTGFMRLCDIEIQNPSAPDSGESFSINENSSAEDIKSLQELLIAQGWLSGTADGVYGNQTRGAVRAFQAYVNSVEGEGRLAVSGVADGDTLDLLLEGRYLNPAVQPTASDEIVFTEVFETLYVRAKANGTALYDRPDINYPRWNVSNTAEYLLSATGGEWLKILNPANQFVAYGLKDEFDVYSKQSQATATPTPVPTSTPTHTPEPTSQPTAE